MGPDALAILDGSHRMTYRELNQRANTLARRLSESGLSRGALALVRMPRGSELAVVLLGVLKAGACYAWIEPGSAEDQGALSASFCILRGRSGSEDRYIAVDVNPALRESATQPGPNLPVLARGSDIACVLPDGNGRPHVLVPHATITALPKASVPWREWESTPGALDLWLGLMSGATLAIGVSSPAAAAA